jgi:hypothetical protein
MAMLFNTADIKPFEVAGVAAPSSCIGGGRVLLGGSLRHLEGAIGVLEKDVHLHFVTMGKWSMHQLVIYLIDQIGPAALYMTSWSMTEQPLRALLNLKLTGGITEAHCILSDRVIERTPEVYDVAKHVFTQLKLIKLHAKVCVLQNADWCIAIVGSANWTKNPRVEAGVIDTRSEVGLYHKKWILDELGRHN